MMVLTDVDTMSLTECWLALAGKLEGLRCPLRQMTLMPLSRGVGSGWECREPHLETLLEAMASDGWEMVLASPPTKLVPSWDCAWAHEKDIPVVVWERPVRSFEASGETVLTAAARAALKVRLAMEVVEAL